MNRITLQPNRRRRTGFTLIELMVVISIILILVGVSIAGISQVSKHSKTQRTQTALETARSLMAGYVASDSTQSELKKLYSESTPRQTQPFDSSFTTDLDPTTRALNASSGPNGEKRWSVIKSNNATLAHALDYTTQAMQLLLRVPENRAIMDKLPAESKYILLDDQGVPLVNVPPLLADGNGEPMLFVPPQGLSIVTVAGSGVSSTGIVQSDGRVHPYPPTPDPYPNPLSRSFFASAGSDRDFTKGDDNAYSFHQ